MKNNRRKILSNKAFHAIWDKASKVDTYEELKQKIQEDKKASTNALKKNSGITYDEALFIYKALYECYNTSFAEIMKLASVSNSEIRDIFNIPIRSIEEWKSGRNRCPDYIRLMLLRYFHLISLGKHIYSEDQVVYLSTLPKVYKDRKGDSKQEEIISKSNCQSEEDILNNIDKRIKAIEESQKARDEIYRVSKQLKRQPSPDILNETDFIDRIIHKNKK